MKTFPKHRLTTTLYVGNIVYLIEFENQERAAQYWSCFKKIGHGEGVDWVLKAGKSEEQLIKDLKKHDGFKVIERPYRLGELTV